MLLWSSQVDLQLITNHLLAFYTYSRITACWSLPKWFRRISLIIERSSIKIEGKKKYFTSKRNCITIHFSYCLKISSCSTNCLGCKLSVMIRLHPKYMQLWLDDSHIFISQQTRSCIMDVCSHLEANCKTYNTRNQLLLQPKQLLPAGFNEKTVQLKCWDITATRCIKLNSQHVSSLMEHACVLLLRIALLTAPHNDHWSLDVVFTLCPQMSTSR